MNFLNHKTILKDLLRQGDVMNTVNGGFRQTDFKIKNFENSMIIEVSNPSVSPEDFSFTINKNELLINVVHFEQFENEDQARIYPVFFKTVDIPFYVDITKVEAIYESGIFKIILPYNNNLPKTPFSVRVKNRDT